MSTLITLSLKLCKFYYRISLGKVNLYFHSIFDLLVDDVIDIFVGAVNHIPKHRRVKVFQLLVKGTSLPKILAKLVEKKEEASLIATQLALKYEISEVLIAIEEMIQVDFLSWIDSLLGNKIFKGVFDREIVEGIMEKVFGILQASEDKGKCITNLKFI